MLRHILLLSFLFTIVVNNNIYAQDKFISWPDKNIRNQLRDFTDIYKQLDITLSFDDLQYPLSASDAVKETISCARQIDPNDPFLKELNSPEAIRELKKEINFENSLRVGFISIVRQRVVFEQYRFANVNLVKLDKTTSKLESSFDSIRWYLYEYNNHPRTKIQMSNVENKWVKKTCCNYFKWYGDFLTLQNLFNDLGSITNHFRRLWEIQYDVEDSDFEKDYMPKHSYTHPASYYLVDNKNTEVSYLDMVNDVNNCHSELQKLSVALKGKIADTTNIAKVYSQNKERWLSSLIHSQDSLTSYKTSLEDSIRLLRRKHNLYKKQADSISAIWNSKRKEKDSLTIVIKAVTVKVTDSTSRELFLNKLRRDYTQERDNIYKRCGDPNCKDSTVIAELKVVNEKIDKINKELDVIGKQVDNLQKRKRNLNTLLSECSSALKQLKQADNEISEKLSQASTEYNKHEKEFYPIIKECDYLLSWVDTYTEKSKFFFDLNYDKTP